MIVVTGATGNIGRPLVKNLIAGGQTVTAVSRGASAPLAAAAGLTAVRADLADPGSLAPAFQGADALFLLVHFCRDRSLMGEFVNARITTLTAAGAGAIVAGVGCLLPVLLLR